MVARARKDSMALSCATDSISGSVCNSKLVLFLLLAGGVLGTDVSVVVLSVVSVGVGVRGLAVTV